MPNENNLNQALERIATLLEGSGTTSTTSVASPTSNSTTPTTTTANPTTTATTTTSGSNNSLLTESQKNEIAQFVYYSMSLPQITREDLLRMEIELPEIVKKLGLLNASPTTRAEYLQIIEETKNQQKSTERSESNASYIALVESLRAEAFGENERLIPLIALGIASMMASYTIVNNWNR